MNISLRPWILGILTFLPATRAHAQAVVYTDEGAFLAALTAQGFSAIHEGFEDDAAWGGVRTTISGGSQTAPSIHSLGLTWLPNSVNSEITTGAGPARTGMYGFFELPHGDWASGIRDGFGATGDTPLVAIGGWIETNTPFAKIALYLDGVPVDFGGANIVGTQHSFFGAIDPAGFSHFDYLELEAMPNDWKYIFADDFTFAFGGTLIDCNQNGVADALDIAGGISGDCNQNLVPDECEIDENSTAPGGPYYCTENCDPDCNNNGLLDECEAVTPVVHASGPLSPFGDGFPQSFLIFSPPPTRADVILDFRAYANLGGSDEYIDVDLNGVPVGAVFVNDGGDCPDTSPDLARLIVPRDTFNGIVGGGNALIGMMPTTEVDVNDCNGPSYVEVDVTLFVPSSQDLDGNGILDECEDLGTRYCLAAPNSASPGGAHVHALGSAVVADNGFRLETRELPPNVFGVHFFGPNQLQLPFGDGYRCVGGSIRRLHVIQADGWGIASDPVDLGAPPALGVLLPGVTRNFQFWYRDTPGGPAGFNLTDAVEVTFL